MDDQLNNPTLVAHVYRITIGAMMDTVGKPVLPNATLHVHEADFGFFWTRR